MSKFTDAIAKLTLDQKIALLSGKDFWHTVAAEEIQLKSIRLSDGPSGVRGESFDERKPSISLPSASSLSSTWDEQVAFRFGEVAASEAVDKGVQVVLGPTINLHRSPLGGRHFESYSEDPILTGKLASAYVKGVQSKNIGACPKHYVANDSETERFTVDAVVDEQTLHELYLRPFEIAVKESQPWMLMSAYNSVNGHLMSESPLLTSPLKTDWGFDGVVVSDWTAVRTVESAATDQDLVMPGPVTPWNAGLKEAVLSGQIPEALIDKKLERILELAQRVGKFGGEVQTPTLSPSERILAAREISEQGMVLLKNIGVLPLGKGVKLAVSGDSARRPRIQGGGSAQVVTSQLTSPLDALREMFGPAQVSYSMGAELLSDCATFAGGQITNPGTQEPGCKISFYDAAGNLLGTEKRESTFLIWNGEIPFTPTRVEAEFLLDVSNLSTPDLALGISTVNRFDLLVDGLSVLRRDGLGEYHDIAEAILQPPTLGTRVELSGRKTLHVKAILSDAGIPEIPTAISMMIGEVARNDDPEQLIAAAVAEAKNADVAVVIVGTNSAVESEGFDRKSIRLPGYQDDLVRAVASANLNTVVIVNSGSPVDMPWRDDVAAIIVSWFGGQEMGPALSNVLSGKAEPSGHLPTSWVMMDEGEPLGTTPSNGKLNYSEGLNIGYRRFDDALSFPFGFGLGYGNWNLKDASIKTADQALSVSVTLENDSDFASRGFFQVYASKKDSAFIRPNRWLVGWGRTAPLSGSVEVLAEIPQNHLMTYQKGWLLEPGEYEIQIARHAGDPGLKLVVKI